MSLHHKHLKEAPTSQGTPFPRNRIKYLPTFSWADFIGLGIFIPGMSDFFILFLFFWVGSTGSVPFSARRLLDLSPHATLLSHNLPTGSSCSRQLHLFVCAIRLPHANLSIFNTILYLYCYNNKIQTLCFWHDYDWGRWKRCILCRARSFTIISQNNTWIGIKDFKSV